MKRKGGNMQDRLKEYMGEDRVTSSLALQEEIAKAKKPEIIFRSKIALLDRLIGGFEPGELTVVSGLTGNGKTLFCQTLTKNFEEQKIYSLWFSYELIPKNFLKSFGDPLCFFYLPRKMTSNTIPWIEQRIQEGIQKYNIKIVFIDHLHFLVDLQRLNISVEIGALMRKLKKIAIHNEICLFLIAHTMKISTEKELDLGDTRDSSFVEQEADNVFYLWRLKNGEENRSILKIAKNRRHGMLGKKIPLIKKNLFLEEYMKEG